MTREEAISGLKEIRDWAGLPYCIEEPLGKEGVGVITTEMIDMAIKALEQEPKTGHWVRIKPYPLQMHDYECSECGHETDDNTENYCSNCGAKMKSEVKE